MKKKLIISFIITVQTLFGQSQFQMRYGSQYYDEADKVIQTQDGNYILVGYTLGFGSAGNALIMKVNPMGAILWSKDYSGINTDIILDVIELPDKKLMMCGRTNSYGAGLYDAFVMQSDSLGNLIWARAYGDIGEESFSRISKDETNGFYVAGYVYDFINMGAAISRMDSVGNILWTKRVTDNTSGTIDMTPIVSGGVILAEAVSPNSSFSLYKFSALGNLDWSNNYLPTPVYSGLGGLAILENYNGDILVNFLVANVNTVAQSGDNFIMTLDNNGGLISDKSYGGTYSDYNSTISKTSDGGIIMCGYTNSAGNGSLDACLIKLLPSGSVQWAKAYGTVWEEYSSNAIQTSDGGFILTGETFEGYNNDSSKVYLVKTDSLGNSSCNDISWNPIVANQTVSINSAIAPGDYIFQQANEINWSLNNRYLYTGDICNLTSIPSTLSVGNSWEIYPNPFSTTATIGTDEIIQFATFEMFDLSGKKVKQLSIVETKSIIIHRDNLQTGLYIYHIISQDNKILDRGKIILQ